MKSYLEQIKSFEGYTTVAQWDYAQPTNGYGTKAKFVGEVISRQEAETRFQKEIDQARAFVDHQAPNADEGTKAALTSLTFNAGSQWATDGLGEAVRRNDLAAIKSIFLTYDKAGGSVVPGLTTRRIAEASWIGSQAPTEPQSQVLPASKTTLGNTTVADLHPSLTALRQTANVVSSNFVSATVMTAANDDAYWQLLATLLKKHTSSPIG